ncbi:MAG: hypothetical protein U0T56_09810 [Ferruginibacter sp.]
MNWSTKYPVKKILVTSGWVILGAGCLFLLASAVKRKNGHHCEGIEINISGTHNHFFIDKSDVMEVINRFAGRDAIGQSIESFDLVGMETELEKDVWVKNAEIYFDSKDVLQAEVEEREPIARVFTTGTRSFYIDSTRSMLPLSEKFSARVPVFTGFPSEAMVLTKADSNLLMDIKAISLQIQQDSLMNALIQQVDITPARTFEMVPYIGEQVIVLGDARDLDSKFHRLALFYKKIMTRFGWNRYSIINLQYKGQVVAKLAGRDDISADSLRTVQMMQTIAATAERLASDSIQTIMQDNERNTADSTMILQSIQREEASEPTLYFENMAPKPEAPVIQPVAPSRVNNGRPKPGPGKRN